MIDDVPYNHCVYYFPGLSFHPDPDLSLDALHLSGPSYHTSGEEGVTLVVVHLLQSTAAAAADVPDEKVLACCWVSHCIFHPGALPSCMISRIGRVWSVKFTRFIQHGFKHVLRSFLPLFLLFWCPLSLSFIPWCPLLRTILLPLIVSVTRLILYYHCHLIRGISIIRSFFSSSSSEVIAPG